MDLNSICKYGDTYPLLVFEDDSIKAGLCNPSILYKDGKFVFNLRDVNYVLYHAIGATKYMQEGGRFASAWGPLSYLHPDGYHKLVTKNYAGTL